MALMMRLLGSPVGMPLSVAFNGAIPWLDMGITPLRGCQWGEYAGLPWNCFTELLSVKQNRKSVMEMPR